MKNFRESVVLLKDDGSSKFPAHFENEIYYARDCQPITFEPNEVTYTSNISLKCVHSGFETYLINGEKKEVRTGQVLFVNDQSDVRLLSVEGNSTSIFLNPDLVADCLESLQEHSNEFQPESSVSQYTGQLFDATILNSGLGLNKLKEAVDFDPETMIPSDYYHELASNLVTSQLNIEREINKIESVKLSTRIEIYRRINRAKIYLNDTLKSKFDLNELAKEASMSKFQLMRHFKQVFGITPHRYFIMEKLKQTYTFLRKSDMLVKEIAHDFGYPDSATFIKQFRQFYGMSPGELRTASIQ